MGAKFPKKSRSANAYKGDHPKSKRTMPRVFKIGGTVFWSVAQLTKVWPLTYLQALSALRKLGVPCFWMGDMPYFKLFALEEVLSAVCEPGATGVALPSSNRAVEHRGRKKRANLPERVVLDADWYEEFQKYRSRHQLSTQLGALLYSSMSYEMLEKAVKKLADRIVRKTSYDKKHKDIRPNQTREGAGLVVYDPPKGGPTDGNAIQDFGWPALPGDPTGLTPGTGTPKGTGLGGDQEVNELPGYEVAEGDGERELGPGGGFEEEAGEDEP